MAKIFVFGSNESGVHGAGAAKEAYRKYGARYGHSYGLYGQSFAIPTKDVDIGPMPLERVVDYVTGFLAFARGHKKMTFQVTRIGCGLAGFKDSEIAELFAFAPKNCQFDEVWRKYLGDEYTYWGTF